MKAFTATGQEKGASATGSASGDLKDSYPNPKVDQISTAVRFTGVLSPTSLGADKDDYTPTGLSDSGILRLTSSLDVDITGIAGGSSGRILIVENIGANTISLLSEDIASAAANRFALDTDAAIAPDTSILLIYDATSTRWRRLGSGTAGSYTHPNHSGDVTSVGDGATTVAAGAVTYAKMQDVSATDKILGRSTAGAGDVEEIACTAAGRAILDDVDAAAQRSTLGLGALAPLATVGTSQIDDAAVTYTKIQDVSATDKVLGRSTAGAGDVEEISCTAAGRALIDDADASAQRSTLGLGALAVLATVGTSQIDASAVTYAKIQDVSATDKVLGRSTAGAGAVEEIACTTAARTVLDDTTVGAMVNTLGGASSSGTGGLVRISGASLQTPQLDTPVISDLTSANHTHLSTAQGGVLNDIAMASLVQIDQDRILGREASGVGDIEVLENISGSLVRVPKLGVTTYADMADFARFCGTAGRISGGEITDNGGGTFAVAAGTGMIRSTASNTAELYFCDWAEDTTTAMTDGTVRYVGIIYNSGSPAIDTRATDDWNYWSEFPLGMVARVGSVIHINQNGREFADQLGRLIKRFYGTRPYERDERGGGLIIGELGTRNVSLSAGRLWDRSNNFDIAAIDTSGADRFTSYYRDGASGFTEVATQSQWPNTQYDDGTGTLNTLAANKYANLWWYIETDGNLVMLYGRGTYTSQALAAAETAPATVPARITGAGRLIGRFIFNESDATTLAIETVWSASTVSTGVTDHGGLSGLADSDHVVSALAFAATDKLAGRSTAGAGVGEEIACTAAGRAILDDADASAQRTTLGLGALATLATVGTTQIDTAAVTYAKIQDVSDTDKLLGRSTVGAGDVEEIACTAAGRAILDDADASAQRTTLGLGALATLATVGTTQIDAAAVTYAKIQDISATDKLLGRSTAGAGVTEEIACTAAGRAILDDVDASTQRSTLGLGALATLATVGTTQIDTAAVTYAKIQDVSATDKVLGRSTAGAGDVEEIACTAAGRAILDDADASAQRTTLGLAIGTNVQAYDAELAALAGLTSAADKLPYFTGSGTAAVADITAAARTILDDASVAAILATLLGAPLASPTFTGTPAAPTAAVDVNTTQIATTAGLIAQMSAVSPIMNNGDLYFFSRLPGGGTFQTIGATAYWVYIGRTLKAITPTRVYVYCTTAGAGAQTAEVGFYSTPLAPNGASQSLTKLVATGTVDALTGTGIKGNTSVFGTSIAAGTHLWAGFRGDMASTEPILSALGRDNSKGYVLALAGASAINGAGPWTGAVPTISTNQTSIDIWGMM